MVNKSVIENVANDATNIILTSSAERNLDIVRHALEKYKVPDYAYSLGTEGDEKVNLFYEDGHWMVTNVERGARCFEGQYDNIDAATVQFFDELSETKYKFKQMNRYYEKNKATIPVFEKNCIHEAIINALTKIASY